MTKKLNPWRESKDLLKQARTAQWRRKVHAIIFMIFKWELNAIGAKVLEVGTMGPMIRHFKKIFKWDRVSCTGGLDLDYYVGIDQGHYDLIIFSHTIEHLCNPLTALESLRYMLNDRGRMIVALPQRKRFQQHNHHFHEIDDKRMRYLFQKSGFEVIDYVKYNNPPAWWKVIGRIRPMLYYFRQTNGVYLVRKG